MLRNSCTTPIMLHAALRYRGMNIAAYAYAYAYALSRKRLLRKSLTSKNDVSKLGATFLSTRGRT